MVTFFVWWGHWKGGLGNRWFLRGVKVYVSSRDGSYGVGVLYVVSYLSRI